MKKASIPVIILIIAVTASLAILSIKIFESADSFFQSVNKNGDKPEVTYNYSLLRDEMSKVSFDIYMQVEAPTGGYGTGFLKKPKYWATLRLSAEEGEINITVEDFRVPTQEYDDDISTEAHNVFNNSHFAKEIFSDPETSYSAKAIEISPYIIAVKESNDRINDGRKCAVFIYERSNQNLLYMLTVELDEHYCFSSPNFSRVIIKNVSLDV